MKDKSSDDSSVQDLCAKISEIAEAGVPIKPVPAELVESVLKKIEGDRSLVAGMAEGLGLADHLKSGHLYQRFATLEVVLPDPDSAYALVGELWTYLFESSPLETQETLIADFTTKGDFFFHFYALPRILQLSKIGPESLADWLQVLQQRSEGDTSQPIYLGLSVVAEQTPDKAVEILERWLALGLNESLISMAAHLLAHLRCHHQDRARKIDHALRSSDSVDRRRIHFRSWGSFDATSPLEASHYAEIIESISDKSEAERDEILALIQTTVTRTERCDTSFSYAINWLHDNLPDNPSDYWKYSIITLAFETLKRGGDLPVKPLYEAVPRVLPLEKDHAVIRRNLDRLLAEISRTDWNTFLQQLVLLSDRDPHSLKQIFNPHEHQYVQRVVSGPRCAETAAALLAQNTSAARRLGIKISQNNRIEQLPLVSGKLWTTEQVARIIFQLGADSSPEPPASLLMVALDEHVQACNDGQLEKIFVEQLTMHMKNFPGACLEVIKKRNKNLQGQLLKKALNQAKNYFQGIKKCHLTAINSMQIPGLRRASQIFAHRQRREIQRASEGEGSLMSLIAQKSYLLYGGNEWRTVQSGVIGEASASQEYSTEMEFPRMPMLAPEVYGEWILHCQRAMEDLDQQAGEQSPES